ncbi:hypothetical protein ACIGZJ_31065 [Kitasatospora sp. NPDC052868]|uniref:hypothetical protein n=1 Tax=Kitasatospora sp. NPDC052868 TaxID=3364060 RepID=UPI0037C7EC09
MNPTTTTRTTWHLDDESGLTTRNPKPLTERPTTAYRILDLPDPLLRQFIAVHEAGHAVLMLHLGMSFESVAIADGLGHGPDAPGSAGLVEIGTAYTAPLRDVMLVCAAGERAEDRWLREAGLWTPDRAWVTERLACHDRARIEEAVRAAHPDGPTYGVSQDPGRDLEALHGVADLWLNAFWREVLELAQVLDRQGHLTWVQAAGAAGVPVPCAPGRDGDAVTDPRNPFDLPDDWQPAWHCTVHGEAGDGEYACTYCEKERP